MGSSLISILFWGLLGWGGSPFPWTTGMDPINKCNLFWFLVLSYISSTLACSHTLHP